MLELSCSVVGSGEQTSEGGRGMRVTVCVCGGKNRLWMGPKAGQGTPEAWNIPAVGS